MFEDKSVPSRDAASFLLLLFPDIMFKIQMMKERWGAKPAVENVTIHFSIRERPGHTCRFYYGLNLTDDQFPYADTDALYK